MAQLVFRVEHARTGTGPFQTLGEHTQALAARANALPHLPSPDADGLENLPWAWVFGAPSVDSLKAWLMCFPTQDANVAMVRELHAQGFVLATFVADEGRFRMGKSGLQLAFDRFDCKVEGLMELSSLTSLLH